MPISTKEILSDYSQKFIDALHKSLADVDRISAGAGLYQSVKAPVKILGQKVVMEIRMADYWDFVNTGVSGTVVKFNTPYSFKKKNIKSSAIQKFIINRGIKQFKNKSTGAVIFDVNKAKDKSKGYKTLAFLLGRTIAKRGIRPTHFADNVMEGALKEQLEKELLISVGRQIRVEIKLATNGNNS